MMVLHAAIIIHRELLLIIYVDTSLNVLELFLTLSYSNDLLTEKMLMKVSW